MSFGDRLRERREYLKMSRSELATRLGVTVSAIGNYENGVSSPKEEILYKIFNVLDVDPNYLWQDEVETLASGFVVSYPERDLIKKYRALDESGKETVDFILDKEYARAMDSQHVQEMVNQASSFEDQNNTIRLSNIKHTGKTQTVRIASRNGPSTLTLNEEQLKAARELVKKLQENPEDDIDDDLV